LSVTAILPPFFSNLVGDAWTNFKPCFFMVDTILSTHWRSKAMLLKGTERTAMVVS